MVRKTVQYDGLPLMELAQKIREVEATISLIAEIAAPADRPDWEEPVHGTIRYGESVALIQELQEEKTAYIEALSKKAKRSEFYEKKT